MFKLSDSPGASLTMLALALGCSAAPELDVPGADEHSQEIRGGTETERAGVVRIRFCKNANCSVTNYCTGSAGRYA